MINYLIELAAIHLVLVGAYWLLLKKEAHYGRMRYYLLGATLLAIVIPFLKLPKLFFHEAQPVQLGSSTVSLPEDVVALPVAAPATWPYDVALGIYLLVSAFFLVKFVRNVLFMLRLERSSSFEKWGNLYIRRVRQLRGSFTFFNWIFLSDDIQRDQEEYQAILRHEKAHVVFGHTYDHMLFELFKVCFWWLPTSWLIHKEIRKIHEYQADEYALRSYSLNQYSSILISSTLRSNGLSLASSFHDGLILKRLQEMKRNASNMSPWKPGALATLIIGLFIAFACTEEPVQQMDGESAELFTIVEELPSYEKGMPAFYQQLMSEIRYPLEARKQGLEGRVFAQFVVERDGSLSNIEVVKGIGAGCDEEAVRVLSAVGSFKPGKQRGRSVRVRMLLPITFKLQDKQNPDGTQQGAVIFDEVQVRNSQLVIESSFANGAWKGTIYDEQGDRLPGANIVVRGTTVGTVSDLDGTFQLKAKPSDEVVVSFVGYETIQLANSAE